MSMWPIPCAALSLVLALGQLPAGGWEWRAHIEEGKRLLRQRDYAAAERSLLAALEGARTSPGESGAVAFANHELGLLYFLLGRYGEAERYFKRAILSWQKDVPPDKPGLLTIVNNLTQLYLNCGQFAQAAQLSRVAAPLSAAEPADSARRLENLATLHMASRKFRDAEAAYRQAAAIWQQQFGPEHAEVAVVLNNLGTLCVRAGRPAEAITYYERALGIWRRIGADQEGLPRLLANIGSLYADAGRLTEAEQSFAEALRTAERYVTVADLTKLQVFSGYAAVLRRLKRLPEAKEMERRAQTLGDKLAKEDPSRYSVDAGVLTKTGQPTP